MKTFKEYNEFLLKELKKQNQICTDLNAYCKQVFDCLGKAKKLYDTYSLMNSVINIISNTAIEKSLVNIYSAIILTESGLNGSANQLLRLPLEFAVIAKTIEISKNESIEKKWKNGEEIKLTIEVYKYMIHPKKEEIKPFEEFWGMLCQYTHATIFSQPFISFTDLNEELFLTYSYILTIQKIIYNLLSQYLLTGNVRKFLTRYNLGIELEECDNKIKSIFKTVRSVIPNQLKVADVYSKKWRFKLEFMKK